MIGKILAGASWLTFLVGLVWTGKLSLATDTANVPFPTRSLRLASTEETRLRAAADGRITFRLVIESPDQYDTEEVVLWLDEREAPLRSILSMTGGDSATEWVVDGDEFAIESSIVTDGQSALLVLAEKTVDVRGGVEYRLTTRVEGDDDFFLEHRPAILTGAMKEAEVALPVTDKRPGLVLLCGAVGAFIHLFGIWIRLVVPWREALPPEELEMPSPA